MQFLDVDSGKERDVIVETTGTNHVVIYEFIASIVIIAILKIRKWSLKDFNLRFTPGMIGVGLILLVVQRVLFGVLASILEAPGLIASVDQPHVATDLTILSGLLLIVVNSCYEEGLLVGYLFKNLVHWNPVVIITVSALLRASYHTYLGWYGFINTLLVGVVFGIYYWKYRKLWPLIIAHGIHNLLAIWATNR